MSRIGLGTLIVLLVGLLVPAAAVADSGATIDFEGLAEGSIVSLVSSGSGISGGPSGSVAVFGHNADPAITTNSAMIFDGTCTGGCSGGDDDLFFPDQGNILIISEDLDPTDPDDSDLKGNFFTFDFSAWGSGEVTVESLVATDLGDDRNERDFPGSIQLFSEGVEIAVVPIPRMGNNESKTVAVGVAGVDFMKVNLGGSGAVDDIRVTFPDEPPPPPGDEGCTPGFWKTHPDAWVGFAPGDDFDAVFGVDAFSPDITLMDGLWLGGGGLARLARHGTAALLNAAHPEVDYGLTVTQVVELVRSAIVSGDYDAASDLLEELNERECDVDAGPAEPRPRRRR